MIGREKFHSYAADDVADQLTIEDTQRRPRLVASLLTLSKTNRCFSLTTTASY
jgi:hypothetical protein